jgi:hypothetical protein
MVLLAAPLGCAPDAVVLAAVLAAGKAGDIFAPLGGGGGGGGKGRRRSSSATVSASAESVAIGPATPALDGSGIEDVDAAAQTAQAAVARHRWDCHKYSEPLAALECVKRWRLLRTSEGHRRMSARARAEAEVEPELQLIYFFDMVTCTQALIKN